MVIQPLVSVVMSVFNGEKYLREAILSILNQTFKDFEFIIINDGSTDNSFEVMKSFSDERISIINQENKGLSRSLNIGIKLAQGKYIARMDADDISFEDRFQRQFRFLEENLDYVLVGSKAIIIEESGQIIFFHNSYVSWDEIQYHILENPFFHSSVMFRRNCSFSAGLYFEGIKHHFEDLILWNNLAKLGKMCNLDEYLIKYRLTPSAITLKSGSESKLLRSISKNIIDRGYITIEDQNKLRMIDSKFNIKYRELIYQFHVGKKYLLNGNNTAKARQKFIITIKLNPFFLKSYLYYCFSLLPKIFRKKIYLFTSVN